MPASISTSTTKWPGLDSQISWGQWYPSLLIFTYSMVFHLQQSSIKWWIFLPLDFRLVSKVRFPPPPSSIMSQLMNIRMTWPLTSTWCYGMVLCWGPPFVPCCQTSPLFTQPKKGSSTRCVIPDLSWSIPPGAHVNGGGGGTPKDISLGLPKKMRLPLASGLADNICRAGIGS